MLAMILEVFIGPLYSENQILDPRHELGPNSAQCDQVKWDLCAPGSQVSGFIF